MPRAGFHSSRRADWLAARALLASRRLRRLVPSWIGVFVLILATLYAIRGSLASRSPGSQRTSERASSTERDTLPLTAALRAALARMNRHDSTLRAMQREAEGRTIVQVLSASQQRERDSLQSVVAQLDGALDRASKAPLTASYRALANSTALRLLGRAQALGDTLDLLDRTRQALDPVAAPQREFAQLSERANAIGRTLQELGLSRRTVLARQVAAIESDRAVVQNSTADALDTADVRTLRDSAQREAARADSLLREAREWHAGVQARTDSAERARATRLLGTSPMAAVASVMVIVAVLGFSLAVLMEARAPTIAHAREVERLTGVPVLASADQFRTPQEGRARLQPGTGVDPFRMVYLALTTSGTRERAVCVAGDSPETVADVAGRLAVSAAADECATLVVDVSPGMSVASAYFGWRTEPGFTEAIAGVRLWREVTRPIGSSEGLSIDVIPAGSPRQDTEVSVLNESARREFATFVEEYDFTILVAPTTTGVRLATMVSDCPPTILVVRTARTRLQALQGTLQTFAETGTRVHGIVLV